MKVRYKSNDGTYESTAEIDDLWTSNTFQSADGADIYTERPVHLVLDYDGWRQVR